MKTVRHEEVSRQCRWQRKQRAKGCCITCGCPSDGRVFCNTHAAAIGIKRRHPLKKEWASVDWNESLKHIATKLGVAYTTACKHRRKHMMDQVKQAYRKGGFTVEKNFPGEYYFMHNPQTGEKVRLYYSGRVWEYK